MIRNIFLEKKMHESGQVNKKLAVVRPLPVPGTVLSTDVHHQYHHTYLRAAPLFTSNSQERGLSWENSVAQRRSWSL